MRHETNGQDHCIRDETGAQATETDISDRWGRIPAEKTACRAHPACGGISATLGKRHLKA